MRKTSCDPAEFPDSDTHGAKGLTLSSSAQPNIGPGIITGDGQSRVFLAGARLFEL
jgi:hypothetical protein